MPMQALDRLGLATQIVEAGVEVERVSIVGADLRKITSVNQTRVKKKFGFNIVAIQ